MISGCGGRYVNDTRYRAKPLGDRTAAAHLGVGMCYVYFLAPNYVLYFPPLTVVHIFTPPSLPNKKMVVKTTLCTTGGVQPPPKYPSFSEGVSEFLLVGIQSPSWKYDNGRIFKITPGFKNQTLSVSFRKQGGIKFESDVVVFRK